MATVLRPPLVLRFEPKDKPGVAIRSQDDVSPDTILTGILKGQDRIHRGPGQTTTYDYPNPTPTRRSVSLLSHTYLALALIAGVAAPFAQKDWPVPRGPARPNVGFTDSFDLPLTSILSIGSEGRSGPTFTKVTQYPATLGSPYALLAVVASPFVQEDWPNPRAPARLNLGWTASNPLAFTTVGFNKYDWPVPRGYAPLNLGFTDSFKLPLTTVVGSNEYDWPVPKGFAPLNRGWLDSFKLPLQTIEPANQFDWPNPRGAQRAPDWLFSTALNTLASTVAAPFSETDWPVPRGPSRLTSLSWTDSFKLPLQAIEPFNQYDWPVPSGYSPLNRGSTASFKLPLTTVVGSNQYDWQNPRGYQPTQWRTWTSSFSLPLTTVRGFNQYDWAVPRGPKPTVGDWTASQPLVLIPVQGANQHDWPVPKGYAPLNLGWADSFKLPLTTVAPPFIQRNFPTSRGAKSVAGFENQSLARDFAAAVTRPPSLLDWPNPRGPVGTVSLRTWTDRFKLPLTTVRPPSLQRDWPVPSRGPRRSPQDFFDRNTLNLTSVGPSRPIIGQRLFRRSLGISTTGPNIALPNTVQVQPAGRLRDWPNPRSALRLNAGFAVGYPPSFIPSGAVVHLGPGFVDFRPGRDERRRQEAEDHYRLRLLIVRVFLGLPPEEEQPELLVLSKAPPFSLEDFLAKSGAWADSPFKRQIQAELREMIAEEEDMEAMLIMVGMVD